VTRRKDRGAVYDEQSTTSKKPCAIFLGKKKGRRNARGAKTQQHDFRGSPRREYSGGKGFPRRGMTLKLLMPGCSKKGGVQRSCAGRCKEKFNEPRVTPCQTFSTQSRPRVETPRAGGQRGETAKHKIKRKRIMLKLPKKNTHSPGAGL